MKLEHHCFHVSKSSEDQKKDLHQKLKRFCSRSQLIAKKSPKTIQRSDADHRQVIEGDADKDHSQIIGWRCSQIIVNIGMWARLLCESLRYHN